MSKADEAKRREDRLAERLRENIRRRKAAAKSQPVATKPPQEDDNPNGHTSDTPPSD